MYKQLGMAALAGMAAYGLRNPKYQLVHSDGEARWADLRIFRADDGEHIVHVAGAPVASGYYDFPSDCFWISPEGGGAQKCFKTLSDIAAHYRQTKGRSARGHRASGPILIDSATGKTLKIGDTVTTFRGEKLVLAGMTPPHKRGSTGRVYVKRDGSTYGSEYFPGVINAEWKTQGSSARGRRAEKRPSGKPVKKVKRGKTTYSLYKNGELWTGGRHGYMAGYVMDPENIDYAIDTHEEEMRYMMDDVRREFGLMARGSKR